MHADEGGRRRIPGTCCQRPDLRMRNQAPGQQGNVGVRPHGAHQAMHTIEDFSPVADESVAMLPKWRRRYSKGACAGDVRRLVVEMLCCYRPRQIGTCSQPANLRRPTPSPQNVAVSSSCTFLAELPTGTEVVTFPVLLRIQQWSNPAAQSVQATRRSLVADTLVALRPAVLGCWYVQRRLSQSRPRTLPLRSDQYSDVGSVPTKASDVMALVPRTSRLKLVWDLGVLQTLDPKEKYTLW
jgi:hypothetical protein